MERLATAEVGFGRARSAPSATIWPLPPERLAEIDLEAAGWTELATLATRLTVEERLVQGYFVDPPWSVKDLVGHVAAWHTEAREQLLDLGARSYVPHDVDLDQRNAAILDALRGQPWDVVWEAAIGARAWSRPAHQGRPRRAHGWAATFLLR